MLFGKRPLDAHKLHADNSQTPLLETPDDLARQAALDAIGLDNDEGTFHEIDPPMIGK